MGYECPAEVLASAPEWERTSQKQKGRTSSLSSRPHGHTVPLRRAMGSGVSIVSMDSGSPSPLLVGTPVMAWPAMSSTEACAGSPSAPDEPQGIVFEWPPDQVENWPAREYILNEWYRYHWLGWFVWMFERPLLRRFVSRAIPDKTIELAIPIPVPAASSNYLWLPDIRVLLIIELNFSDHRWLRSVKAAMVDGMAEQILHCCRMQLLPKDLRELDPKLQDFSQPIELNFEIVLNWLAQNKLQLELHDLRTKLYLP